MITIPRRKQKVKYSRKLACKYLKPKGDISYNLQALAYCSERDLVLGPLAFVCQVCSLYSQTNKKIEDIYEESKNIAEKKIKKEELDAFERGSQDFEIDLTTDEFKEEEDILEKFEKRKAGKDDISSDEFTEVECPFCGEIFDDLRVHIRDCEFAPDDVSIEDIMPQKRKKKKGAKRKPGKAKAAGGAKKEMKACPYCGKEFQRLGRHLNSCKKKPKDAKEE